MTGFATRLGFALALMFAAITGAPAQTMTRFPAITTQVDTLSIHAATDLYALEPLIRDFQQLSPGTMVEIVEYVTNDLFSTAGGACDDGGALGDVFLSSSVDQLVKLANDGCAQRIEGADLARAPRWANWRDEVFGFTFEPIVMVYNRDGMSEAEVPRTHLELAELLRRDADRYRGRVGTYDVRLSGIGYLLAFNDARQTTTTYGRLLESLGRAQVVVRCCTSQILDEVAAGRLLIGYNLLGSYAYERVRRGQPIGIVMPADYTLVLSRGAMVPIRAPNPGLATRFVNYLLSERGQSVGRSQSFFFGLDGSAPAGIEGPDVVTSGIARPIVVGPTLLAVQDAARRKRFLEDWSQSVIQTAP
ncbi:iron(III) transport system substrate-binding protein [Ancylobacter sp. 3268]|uniref:ABC transporter substrate-binding protein n=1 Tax=Ancylobacter sp. 3268 TaxID=2817752 RepID=UPI002860E1E1|nr:ABC transporter substrate-binding protein [Ancylobacter sp. 3268]MDR6955487.1 iron(III) transport system substrate-binding protein [Ancylobacter sp. 3268]